MTAIKHDKTNDKLLGWCSDGGGGGGCGGGGGARLETDFVSSVFHRLERFCSLNALLEVADAGARIFSLMEIGAEYSKVDEGALAVGLMDRDMAVLSAEARGAALEPSAVAFTDSEGCRCSITNYTIRPPFATVSERIGTLHIRPREIFRRSILLVDRLQVFRIQFCREDEAEYKGLDSRRHEKGK